MVRRLVSAGCVLSATAAMISCQVLFGIEEKYAAPEDAGAQTGVVPPARPSTSAAPSGSAGTVTFAIRKLYVGSISPKTDESDTGAWGRMGYDIDGKCTTEAQSIDNASGICKREDFVSDPRSQADGEGCRDNAGGHVLAVSLSSPATEKRMQELLETGQTHTLVLQITDLDPGPDDPYAPGKLYVAAPRGSGEQARQWNGTDELKVDSSWLNDGGIDTPQVVFSRGYVRDHVWVSEDFRRRASLALPLPLFGAIRVMHTRTATITLRLDSKHENVLESVISIAVPGTDFLDAVWDGLLFQKGCVTSIAQGYLGVIEKNLDLADTETFLAPGTNCNLTSMGMQPVWAPVKPPVDAVPGVPGVGMCDGGAGDGGAGDGGAGDGGAGDGGAGDGGAGDGGAGDGGG